MTRRTTVETELVRRGAADPERARDSLERACRALGQDPSRVADWRTHLDSCCDVDLALAGLADLAENAPEDLTRVLADDSAARRLVRVLAASQELARHLAAHPGDLDAVVAAPRRVERAGLVSQLLAAVGARSENEGLMVARDEDAADRLRLAYRRELVRVACRDVDHDDPVAIVEDIAAELSDLADAVVTAALAVARAEVPDHADARLAVVAMGKCGAGELNYVSDVDVIHVAAPAREDVPSARAVEVATKVAATLTRICSARSQAGTIWPLDAALRPEGNAGPLVRTVESMASYYRQWASSWEFQALLRARPMAGDEALGEEFCRMVEPSVWSVGERDHFVAQTRAMRARVVAHIPAKDRDREIKLGPGGLRDVEFTAQLLQLVHGRQDESLRVRATLPALRELAAGGYISRGDAEHLADAYRLERVLEHRVQLHRLRRTHLLPSDEEDLRRLARSVGLHTGEEIREVWRATSLTVVRTHDRVFYSPLVEAVARIPSDELRMTPEAAKVRLHALGFHDENAALRHIEALTRGVSRAVRIQTQLMPAMLGWLADGPSPDNGLLAFRQISEALGASPWYLRALRDEGAMAQRLAMVLSTSRYAVAMLTRAPETVQILVEEDLRPRCREALVAEMSRVVARHDGCEEAVAAIRAVRRRELFRIVVAEVLGVADCLETGRGLSDLTDATVEVAMQAVRRDVPDAPPIAVVAMGRWGGGEMGLSSDADAVFVTEDPVPGSASLGAATTVVTRLRTLLGRRGADPGVDLDADLRPEGRSGPLVRSLSSFRSYFSTWSSTWESQAWVRARHGAGDADLSRELLECVDHLRWPEGGLTPSQLSEIRRLKARMENERVRKGADPRLDLKQGPGGLADVEWTVQVLQLCHGAELPALRTPATLEALDAACAAGLVSASQRASLRSAWIDATRMRNAIVLVRGRPSDLIGGDVTELDAMARLMGLGPGCSQQVVEDHLRRARRASKVVDEVFWAS